MHKLESIANQIREKFDVLTKLRVQALSEARQLTRSCSLAIRAVHRNDQVGMWEHLTTAGNLADKVRSDLVNYPDLYYAGYTPDALKEVVEANVTLMNKIGRFVTHNRSKSIVRIGSTLKFSPPLRASSQLSIAFVRSTNCATDLLIDSSILLFSAVFAHSLALRSIYYSERLID